MKTNRGFDNILNECLERLLVSGETIEQCLARHTELAGALKPLLQITTAYQKTIAIEPDDEFRAKARHEFQRALRETASKKRSRPIFVWQFRWATAVATVLILLLASGGMVAVAGSSMPDSPLYPAKLALEQLQLNLTTSPLDKAELYAQLSDKRVTEIIYLAQKGKTALAEVATQRLDNQLTMLARLAITITHKEESRVLEQASPAAAPEMDTKESQGLPQSEGYGDNLGGFLEQHAANNQETLIKALETAPDEVKPVLEQAIEVSQAGYEKVLGALGE